MNTNFGYFDTDGAFHYAEDTAEINGITYTSPKAEHYAAMNPPRLPIIDEPPTAQEGCYAAPTGYEEREGKIYRTYEQRAVEPSPTLISKAKVAAAVDTMGKTAAFMAWLQSKAQYMTAWFDGNATVAYDANANDSDLASLIAALAIPADQIPALIAQVTEEA